MSDVPPVNRSNQVLTDGSTVPEDRSHTRHRGDGQQVGYVVLSDEERAKGWVKPYRDSYRHIACGQTTSMGRKLSETYARDPRFYSGTFCCHCSNHYPLCEFTWLPDGESMDPDMQTGDWLEKKAAAERQAAEQRRQARIAELKRELARLESESAEGVALSRIDNHEGECN